MQCAPLMKTSKFSEERKLIDEVGSLDDRHLLELIAIRSGLKKIIRIHVQNKREFNVIRDYCIKNNFAIKHSSFKLKLSWTNEIGDSFFEDVPWNDEDDIPFVAYVAKDGLEELEKAKTVELEETHRDAGLLYGYPLCCCENYASIASGASWIEVMLGNSKGFRFFPLANKLSYLVYGYTLFPDYFPCNFNCNGTIALSRRYYDLGAESGLKEYVDMQHEMMSRPYLVCMESVYSFSKWWTEDGCILHLKMDSLTCYGTNYLSDYCQDCLIIELPLENINLFWEWNGLRFRVLLFGNE